MADLDAELLALAGGDESSGEESSPHVQQKSSSPSRPVKKYRESSPPSDMARKGTAKPIKKVRRRKDESDDDQLYVVVR